MKKLAYKLGQLLAIKQAEKLPEINEGDELLGGRFKNMKMTAKGLKKDKHNQPVVETNKGDRKVFNFRMKKLMDEKKD